MGVNEILKSLSEYLKSLDVVGLSWLTRLCNLAWQLGTVLLQWQTVALVPLYKTGGLVGVCSIYKGSHSSASFKHVPQGILCGVPHEYGV